MIAHVTRTRGECAQQRLASLRRARRRMLPRYEHDRANQEQQHVRGIGSDDTARRDDCAGGGRPDDTRNVETEVVQGHTSRQLIDRKNLRKDRLPGGLREGRDDATGETQCDQAPWVQRSEVRQDAEQRCRRRTATAATTRSHFADRIRQRARRPAGRRSQQAGSSPPGSSRPCRGADRGSS